MQIVTIKLLGSSYESFPIPDDVLIGIMASGYIPDGITWRCPHLEVGSNEPAVEVESGFLRAEVAKDPNWIQDFANGEVIRSTTASVDG